MLPLFCLLGCRARNVYVMLHSPGCVRVLYGSARQVDVVFGGSRCVRSLSRRACEVNAHCCNMPGTNFGNQPAAEGLPEE